MGKPGQQIKGTLPPTKGFCVDRFLKIVRDRVWARPLCGNCGLVWKDGQEMVTLVRKHRGHADDE
jgi:hypothetical protein